MSETMTRSNTIVCSDILDECFEKGIKIAGGPGTARYRRSLIVMQVIKVEQLVGSRGKALRNPQALHQH